MFTNKDSEKITIALAVTNSPVPLDYFSPSYRNQRPPKHVTTNGRKRLYSANPRFKLVLLCRPPLRINACNKKEVIDLQCEPLQQHISHVHNPLK